MNYGNIPAEMKARVNWCLWRYETVEGSNKPTKVPYHPNGRRASSTDPQTWASFAEVCEAAKDWNRWAGIGYFFSIGDPFCGIDLDDPFAVNDRGEPIHKDPQAIIARHREIIAKMNSYTEVSPSGKGLHIIVKASVPVGRRRDAVEVYSKDRFFTMTGNVFNAAPIADRQELTQTLWEEMAPNSLYVDNGFVGTIEQHHDDATIIEIASKAENGDKFVHLLNGQWHQYYASQSQADFALIDIVAYYTQNILQIVRIFRNSALGQREKANRDDYIYGMVKKSFDMQLAPIDYSALMDKLQVQLASVTLADNSGSAAPVSSPGSVAAPEAGGVFDRASPAFSQFDPDYWKRNKPSGIVGMVIDYCMARSPVPLYETGVVSAFGLVGGIAGRQYNISKTGLNLYLMFVAPTGNGKETIAATIDSIVNGMVAGVGPTLAFPAAETILGPADMASGQALLKMLSNRTDYPCCVSLIGEFGFKLQQLTDPRANASEKNLMKVLLDLFGKSAAGQSIKPSVYADKANNTAMIHSPALTLIGESTGDTFYKALDEENVASGLLPRFIVTEYTGDTPNYNWAHVNVTVPVQLVEVMNRFYEFTIGLVTKKTVYNINMSERAEELSRIYQNYAFNKLKSTDREVIKQLWNRVHLKILRVAGLLAVSDSYEYPMVTEQHMMWAASFVMSDVYNLTGKFDRGEMGSNTDENEQIKRIRNVIRKFFSEPFGKGNYGASSLMHRSGALPYSFFAKRFASDPTFKNDRLGAKGATRNALKELCDMGELRMIPANQMVKDFDYNGPGYAVLQIGSD